jgi:hypothetical protein
VLRGNLDKDSLSRPRFAVPGWSSSFRPDFLLFYKGSVVKERSEIFLLRILDSWTDMSCLVLRGVDTRNATYERIGFVKSTNKDWRRAKWLETTLTVI